MAHHSFAALLNTLTPAEFAAIRDITRRALLEEWPLARFQGAINEALGDDFEERYRRASEPGVGAAAEVSFDLPSGWRARDGDR